MVKRNQVDMFRYSLKNLDENTKRQFVNQASNNGWSVLMNCANDGSLSMAREMVANGADVNHSMDTGWTAMHTAAKMSNGPILEMLLQNGGNKNLLARHRDFGANLKVEEVTADQRMLDLLQRY